MYKIFPHIGINIHTYYQKKSPNHCFSEKNTYLCVAHLTFENKLKYTAMKKLLYALLAVVITAAVATAVIFTLNKKGETAENKGSEKPFSETALLLIDLKQLVEKGEFAALLEPEQRQLYATLLASQTETEADAEYIRTIAEDFTKLGLSIETPAYGYLSTISEDAVEGAIVVDVANAKDVDTFIEFLSRNGAPMNIERKGNTRHITSEEFGSEVAIGYNDDRFVIALSSIRNGQEMLAEAFKTAAPNFAAFEGRDIAMYLDLNTLLNIVDEELREESFDAEAELAQFNEVRKQFGKNASLITGLTFDSGRITLDITALDINAPKNNPAKVVSNKHLAYIPNDTFAVANIGVNGANLSTILSEVLTPDLAEQFGISRNEFNAMKEIARGALGSIDGDITLAVNRINGSLYNSTPYIVADVLVDVRDRYIISNVGLFAQGFATQEYEDAYVASLDNYNDIYFGQQDNILYASLNNLPEELPNSATTARWAKELNNCYGYVLVDIVNLLKQSFVESAMSELYYEIGPDGYIIFSNILNMFDYALLINRSTSRSELSIVLSDKQTNSLKQIVDQAVEVAPIIRDLIFGVPCDDDDYYYEDEYYYDDEEYYYDDEGNLYHNEDAYEK